jgi:hypothetical protein
MAYKEDEKFSDDPIEHLRIENEFIKMKLKAQFGDQFQIIGNPNDIPPELENKFLKDMILMEESYRNADLIPILEKIGNPVLKDRRSLTKKQLKQEVEKLIELIECNDLHIAFTDGPYEDAVVYDFLVNEFVKLQVEKEIMAGMTRNYIYEEFHPNHKAEVARLSVRFLKSWTTKDLNALQHTWHETLMAPKRIVYTQEQLAEKIGNIFDSFEKFENAEYSITDMQFDIHDDEVTGMGSTEGHISFDGIMTNGEMVHFSGNYKLFYSFEHGFWNVFYFIMPSFVWQPYVMPK